MENASLLLSQKVARARRFIERAGTLLERPESFAPLGNELKAIEISFHLASCSLWLEAEGGPAARARAISEFSRVMASGDFGGAIDRVLERAVEISAGLGAVLRTERVSAPVRRGRGRKKGDAPAPRGAGGAKAPARGRVARAAVDELQRMLCAYPAAAAAGPAPARDDLAKCATCGGPTAADAGHSELRCRAPGCGAVRELVGTVFDDSQFYSQEGQKAKSGAFKPNRHFREWWTHLLALEPEEELGDKDDPDNLCGEKLLAQMRALVQRDRLILRTLTVDAVRGMLRELKRTELNVNVSLILKKLTGVGPPAVPASIATKVENIFSKATEVGERLLRPGRANRNYYPDYMLRIYIHVLDTAGLPKDVDRELRRLIFYFYLQSDETVRDDDNDWRLIVENLPDLRIRATPLDRSIREKYPPL